MFWHFFTHTPFNSSLLSQWWKFIAGTLFPFPHPPHTINTCQRKLHSETSGPNLCQISKQKNPRSLQWVSLFLHNKNRWQIWDLHCSQALWSIKCVNYQNCEHSTSWALFTEVTTLGTTYIFVHWPGNRKTTLLYSSAKAAACVRVLIPVPETAQAFYPLTFIMSEITSLSSVSKLPIPSLGK